MSGPVENLNCCFSQAKAKLLFQNVRVVCTASTVSIAVTVMGPHVTVSRENVIALRAGLVWHVKKVWTSVIYEPTRGKTNNVVSEQVRHKPACTSTEKS